MVMADMSVAGYAIQKAGSDSNDARIERDVFVDAVAEVAHDAWGAGKITGGWPYAPVRDNELKHHPSLLPYDMLSDSEKQYDIDEVMSVYDVLNNAGYVIVGT